MHSVRNISVLKWFLSCHLSSTFQLVRANVVSFNGKNQCARSKGQYGCVFFLEICRRKTKVNILCNS
uniref:Secreted protein n=1 Tax=Arundo donax TaxID=35708 RepID=A0A0A9GXM8_ARUDO